MAMLPQASELLAFLDGHPEICSKIKAPYGATLLYCGIAGESKWRNSLKQAYTAMGGSTNKSTKVGIGEGLPALKMTNPEIMSKTILPEVLKKIDLTKYGKPTTLLAWAEEVDAQSHSPKPVKDDSIWMKNAFVVWCKLSGIFVSNAEGKISFYIGSADSWDKKVFLYTELPLVFSKPDLDATTKKTLLYYQRCFQSGKTDIDFALIQG